MKGELKYPVKNLKSIQTAKKTNEEIKSVERNHFFSKTENQ